MLTKEQNEALTRVGPGTRMGELMRRYWIPALLSWELPEPDCPPLEVRLLGEDLVAFRQTDGEIGMVSAYCAHRRASLFWGRNEENGIRCVYHGWKFDLAGRCVDMPSEPASSNFKDRVQIPAYPTYEAGGVVWAYMGPPDKKPALPLFEWTQVPPTHRGMSKVVQECNWLQAFEGGIDSSHINFLHGGKVPGARNDTATVMGRAREVSLAPEIEVVPTDYGYTYAGIRPMGDEGNYVRGYHWIAPWTQLRPGGDTGTSSHMWIPIDDFTTMVYNIHYNFPEAQEPRRVAEPAAGESLPIWFGDARQSLGGSGNEFGVDIDVEHGFRSVRNAGNRYLIDRQVQKTQTYTGIQGTNTQDRAIQESMGGIADRTLERLGTTDRAIINSRRSLLHALRVVEDGGDPPGVAPSYYKLRSNERVLPRDAIWYEAMKPLLFQIGDPNALSAGKRLSV